MLSPLPSVGVPSHSPMSLHQETGLTPTFLVGEWRTGAGGDGGPRGIFWFILNFGGSMGSFCASIILIILCLEPELKATACVEGV